MKRFVILALSCLAAGAATAQVKYGKLVTISQPVYEDLYVAGGTVIINAPIHGDLVVAGGTVNVNDSVLNDILVAGGNITFNGYAGDDIRCAGGNIHVMKNVAGDLVVTGGEVFIEEGATIGGIIAGGGNITINGNVTGGIRTASGKLVLNGPAKELDCRGTSITINGRIDGPATIAANDALTIGSNAAFAGDVRYWSPSRTTDFKQSLKGGTARFDPSLRYAQDQWYFLGFTTLLGMLWYAGMALVLIILAQYLFGSLFKKAGESMYQSALRSLGFGLLYWIGVPVAAAIAMITIIGVPVGLLLMAMYVALLLMASIIVSVTVANLFARRYDKPWGFWKLVGAAFMIFMVLKVVTFTPFLGRLIWVVLVCMAFGAIAQHIKWKKEKHLLVM